MNLKDYLAQSGDSPIGRTKEWLPLSRLPVTTGALWAGDPLLANDDDGCTVEVPAGDYLVEAIGRTWEYGRCTAGLRVRLEAVSMPAVGDEIGDTGTDSGMIAVCDIWAFLAAFGDAEPYDRFKVIEPQTSEGCGVVTVAGFPNALMPFVPTGSDGMWPVFALVSGGECVGIELPFMFDDDED